MINQKYTGTPSSRRFVTLPVAANVKAGDPLLVGGEACFALDNYQANVGGATCLFNGTFNATVIAKSSESPSVGHAIKPGDPIYASGTLDSTTNVTYGLTLDANSGNTLFGHLDPSETTIASTTTNTAAGVQINAV